MDVAIQMKMITVFILCVQKVTTEFLEWCKEAGNDLITPHPEFGFPGLKDGDGWCVCASTGMLKLLKLEKDVQFI